MPSPPPRWRSWAPAHVARFGSEPALLVKLLDAGQRLPVHFHPGRAFAREALGSRYGKTEAWVIVEAEPGASVHVAFDRDVEPASCASGCALRTPPPCSPRCTSWRSTPATWSSCRPGPRTRSAQGMLMVELQEPTDFSVLLEWDGFELTEDEGHLELGWDRALEALDRGGWDEDRARALKGRALPADADAYFRAERLAGGSSLDPGFSILMVLGGAGTLATEIGRARAEPRRGRAPPPRRRRRRAARRHRRAARPPGRSRGARGALVSYESSGLMT